MKILTSAPKLFYPTLAVTTVLSGNQAFLVWLQLGCVLLLFNLLPVTAAAQTTPKATITGQATEISGKAAGFVTVLLLRGNDSTMVTGTVTDSTGHYQFTQVAAGLYKVGIASMGYQKMNSQAFLVTADTLTVTAPVLTARADAKMLKEVQVTGLKPLIEIQADKTVFNVENSPVAAGGTALDVLERAPGVQVDAQNDRLSLQGRAGVTVMLDGKPTYLSMQALMSLLRNTPSNSIQSIELITNPSAKYDAAGNSGIINIKLKRGPNQIKGTNGSITVGAGQGRMPKFNTGVSLNHQQGKWSLFGNYNYDYGATYVELTSRTIFIKNIIRNNSYRIVKPYTNVFKVGADYALNKNNTLGFMLNGMLNRSKSDLDNRNQVFSFQDRLLQYQPMHNDIRNGMDRFAFNVNYKLTLDTAGQHQGIAPRELLVDLDYGDVSISQHSDMVIRTLNLQDEETSPTLYQRNPSFSDLLIRAGKLDYVHPISKNLKLEAGLKSSNVTSNNDVRFEVLRTDWETDRGRTNQFIYQENINAAYLNVNQDWGKWTLQGGLRLEHTHSVGNLVTTGDKVDRNYVNLFPSIFLGQKLSNNHQLRYSYSRRIDRPDYLDLNPFVYVTSPFTYYQGNALLRPQYTNAFQVGYTYKNQTTVSLAYNRTHDAISRVSEQDNDNNQLKDTAVNLDDLTNINLSIGLPLTITKWWNMRHNADIFLNEYKSIYLNEPLHFTRLSANINMNHSFTLPHGITAELSGFYNSATVNGITQLIPRGMVSVGAQKSLWDKKAMLRLNVNDIFHSMRFGATKEFANINNQFRGQFDSRFVRVSFTYNIGNRNIKTVRQRRSSSEEEQRRVGGGNN